MKFEKYNGIHVDEKYPVYEAFSEEFAEGIIGVAEDLVALSKISNKNKYAADIVLRSFKEKYPNEMAKYITALNEDKQYLKGEREKVAKTIESISKCKDTKSLVAMSNAFSRYALCATDQIEEDLAHFNRTVKKAKKVKDIETFMDSYYDIAHHTVILRYRVKTIKSIISRTAEFGKARGFEEEPLEVEYVVVEEREQRNDGERSR